MLKLTSRWNRLYTVLAVVSTFSIFSCQKTSLTFESPEAQLNKKAAVSAQAGATIATLNWDQTYQKIDGFGDSEAGLFHSLNPQREIVS
ncbi:hypothetical protein [Sphingobacterium multivorum]|jgi:O-glycosyl hydrolase|uniref:hypothetical protein n=1 Tax=Sphingobacterium multivorum TaxID=28454 RepID=UPI0028A677A8|nr:hypothetical protein [Sphingobacterium multivorum]